MSSHFKHNLIPALPSSLSQETPVCGFENYNILTRQILRGIADRSRAKGSNPTTSSFPFSQLRRHLVISRHKIQRISLPHRSRSQTLPRQRHSRQSLHKCLIKALQRRQRAMIHELGGKWKFFSEVHTRYSCETFYAQPVSIVRDFIWQAAHRVSAVSADSCCYGGAASVQVALSADTFIYIQDFANELF